MSALGTKLWVSMVALLCLAVAQPGQAAIDMFLKIDALAGESQDPQHAKEMDILAWSWGAAHAPAVNGSITVGRPAFQGLTLTKYVDSASPGLLAHCASGEAFTHATLTMRNVSASSVEFYHFDLTNVVVTSVSTGGSGGEDRLTETITLTFAGVLISYVPLTSVDTQTAFLFQWDIAMNVGSESTGPYPPPPPPPLPPPPAQLGSSLSYVNGAPTATLGWTGAAGATYQVWVASDPQGPYMLYGGVITADSSAAASLTLPASATRQFFRVQSLGGN